MRPFNSIALAVLSILFISCNSTEKKEGSTPIRVESEGILISKEKINKAETIISATIKAHGGEKYDVAYYGFSFREKRYTFKNQNKSFTYTVNGIDKGDTILDILNNGELNRKIDGMKSKLSQKDIAKYTEALNSVVYFVTLPHKLNDKAVNKKYEGIATIKEQEYDVIKVTFDKEGGGIDYDDEFRYWISTDRGTMDYMAYSYSTNNGGVRFRSAYNPRTIGGIRFQDYINYEAPIGTPLNDLPERYENGGLKELSRIEISNIVDLGK